MFIIDGKKCAQKVKDMARGLAEKSYFQPSLAIITNPNDEAGKIYVRQKTKACEYCGIDVKTFELTNWEDFRKNFIKQKVFEDFSGVIIQQPNDAAPFDLTKRFLNELRYGQDVDGFTENSPFIPCTAEGIMTLLRSNNLSPGAGDNCVVLGRSKIVGAPLAKALYQRGSATVSICNSHTPEETRKYLLKNAKYVFSCVGKPGLITPQDVRDDAIIVDVGITRLSDGTLCGDAGPLSLWENTNVSITPVPGGVGPMTVAMLMWNTCYAEVTYSGVNHYPCKNCKHSYRTYGCEEACDYYKECTDGFNRFERKEG